MSGQDIPPGWDDIVMVFMLGAKEGELDRIKNIQRGGAGGGGGGGSGSGRGGHRGATDAEMMQMLETVRREREKKAGG